jgi:hypothetical protein
MCEIPVTLQARPCLKKIIMARHWWLTNIILADQEVEIRRIEV